jgi:hypothetical protein
MSYNEKLIAQGMAVGVAMMFVIFAVCAYLHWY